jgi:hypothetical protein
VKLGPLYYTSFVVILALYLRRVLERIPGRKDVSSLTKHSERIPSADCNSKCCVHLSMQLGNQKQGATNEQIANNNNNVDIDKTSHLAE